MSAVDQALVPPQNLEAEDSVLGACLLSANAIAAVVEVVKPADFYRGSHGTIFQAVLDMFTLNRPVDPITLADELDSRGQLEEVGGRSRVNELAALVPATSNAPHYAKIVSELAMMRGLIRAGQEISRLGMERQGEAREVVDRAEQVMFDAVQGRETSDFSLLKDTLKESFERLVELGERGEHVIGLPTGYADLDERTSGLQPGNLIVIGGRPSMGKAQPFDAAVLTPHGFRAMGEICAGDLVIGADGHVDLVTGVYDQGERDIYRVLLADGCSVECCDEHLWLTRTKTERDAGKAGKARSLSEIRETLRRRDGSTRTRANHSLPYVEPVHFAPQPEELRPLDPYWLGLYLGDGDSGGQVRINNPESDIREAFSTLLPPEDQGVVATRSITIGVRRRKRNNEQTATKQALAWLGLAGLGSHEKYVPLAYLMASVEQRVALLQGICDTDGYVTDPAGACIEIATASPQLRDALLFLVRSLGGRASFITRPSAYTKNGERHEARESHRITLSFPNGNVVPVRSQKHLAKWRGGPHLRGRERRIEKITLAGRKRCRCISVTRALYVTDGFAVTHNTAVSLGIAANVTIRSGTPVALFSLEMSRSEVTQRLMSSEALVDSRKIRNGRLDADDWRKLTYACDKLAKAPLYVDDSGAITVLEIRSKARRLKMREPRLGLVVVDYIQLMTSGKNVENRVQEVSQISRALKVLARDLNIPVIAVSQLSRAPEQRHDRRPILSDLRESGSVEQDADLVWFVYRDEYYHAEDTENAGIAEVNIAKHRNGPTGVVKLAFSKSFAKFVDLAPPGMVG